MSRKHKLISRIANTDDVNDDSESESENSNIQLSSVGSRPSIPKMRRSRTLHTVSAYQYKLCSSSSDSSSSDDNEVVSETSFDTSDNSIKKIQGGNKRTEKKMNHTKKKASLVITKANGSRKELNKKFERRNATSSIEKSLKFKNGINKSKKKDLQQANCKNITTLYNKTDEIHATEFLSQITDLLDIIPSTDDCFFLATNYWIFTVEQLDFVLKNDNELVESIQEKLAKHRITQSSVNDKKLIPHPSENIAKKRKSDDRDGLSNHDDNHHTEHGNGYSTNEIVSSWEKSIADFHANANTTSVQMKQTNQNVNRSFPIDGPIQCLLSTGTRNFFTSISIHFLWELLAMKKTEKGVLCQAFINWRNRCNLEELSTTAIAKHLCGISLRIENALKSIPPLHSNNRIWTSDPICVLTSYAKEFLADSQKIYTVSDFLERRTKQLSDNLVSWRETHGMVPLKGSGKVATISSWKAQARESVAAEEGIGAILTTKEILPEHTMTEIDTVTKITDSSDRKVSGRMSFNSKSEVEVKALSIQKISTAALAPTCNDSPNINRVQLNRSSDPLEVLTALAKQFLPTLKISTAEQFLSTRSSDMSNAFAKWRFENGKTTLKGTGAIATISSWKAAVRKALIGIEDDAISTTQLRSVSKDDVISDTIENSSVTKQPHVPHAFSFKGGRLNSSRCFSTDHSSLLVPKISMSDIGKLNGSNQNLFAVSCDGSDKQFLFELSFRRKDPNHDLSPFLTYKGALPCRLGDTKDQKERLGSKAPNLRSMEDLAIYHVVQINKDASPNDSTFDSFASFPGDSSKPSLIDIGIRGLRPFVSQDLTYLKEYLSDFVKGHVFGRDNYTCSFLKMNSKEVPFNVSMRKSGVHNFSFFLYLSQSMEKGQVIGIHFPPVESCNLLVPFQKSTCHHRITIEECVHLLSVGDLKIVLNWLNGSILSQLQPLDGSADWNRWVYESRRRLCWLSRLISDSIGDQITDEYSQMLEKIDIGCATLKTTGCATPKQSIRDALSSQIKQELCFILECDRCCGIKLRSLWCHRAQVVFNALCKTVSQYYVFEFSREEFLSKLVAVVEQELKNHDVRDLIQQVTPHFDAADQFLTKDLFEQYFKNEQQTDKLQSTSLSNILFCYPVSGKGPDCSSTVIMRSSHEIKENCSVINLDWYRLQFIRIACKVLSAFQFSLNKSEFEIFKVQEIISSFCKVCSVSLPEQGTYDASPNHIVPNDNTLKPMPDSLQFFLGLVWPCIRDNGWRLEGFLRPQEVTFLAPDKVLDIRKRAAAATKNRSAKRARLTEELKTLSIDKTCKLTKRLIVATIANRSVDRPISNEIQKPEANDLLSTFLDFIKIKIEQDPLLSKKSSFVVDAVKKCINALASNLSMRDRDLSSTKTYQEDCSSESLSLDTFLQILFILPYILKETNLPMGKLRMAGGIISEIISCFTQKYKCLLHEDLHPPQEEYSIETLRSSCVKGSCGSTEHSQIGIHETVEVILDSYKSCVTDYITLTMGQGVICGANEDDVIRKNRKFELGFPGIVCRHCLGGSGSGKYFFSTVEGLMSSYSVMENHLMKCTKCPVHIKSEIVGVKRYHLQQRKGLPVGCQSVFYSKLWDRMCHSFIEPQVTGLKSSVLLEKSEASGLSSEAVQSDIKQFQLHLDVLNYVRLDVLQTTNEEIQESLDIYYSFLEYGGQVFHTNAMPQNFSSEWLLSKLFIANTRA